MRNIFNLIIVLLLTHINVVPDQEICIQSKEIAVVNKEGKVQSFDFELQRSQQPERNLIGIK